MIDPNIPTSNATENSVASPRHVRLQRILAAIMGFSWSTAIAFVYRYRRLLLGGLLGSAVGLIIGLSSGRHYEAQVSFIPETKGGSGLSQAAGLPFGLLLGSDTRNSPRFYVELLGSRAVEDLALQHSVRPNVGKAKQRLLDVLVPTAGNELRRQDVARRELRKMLSTRIQPDPGIVFVSVSAPTAVLASDIADAVIDAIHVFDVEIRHTEARDRRVFLEQRAGDAHAALDAAENSMERFLETNRLVNAPRLAYERGRLQRNIELRQGIYLTLANQLETSRIEEVNQRPRITLLDAAMVPVQAQPRMLPLFIVAGVVIGVSVAAVPLLISHHLAVADA